MRGTIKITGAGANVAATNEGKRSKQVTFKSCAPFTDCISGINNTSVDIAKNLDVVILMYNLTECSNN